MRRGQNMPERRAVGYQAVSWGSDPIPARIAWGLYCTVCAELIACHQVRLVRWICQEPSLPWRGLYTLFLLLVGFTWEFSLSRYMVMSGVLRDSLGYTHTHTILAETRYDLWPRMFKLVVPWLEMNHLPVAPHDPVHDSDRACIDLIHRDSPRSALTCLWADERFDSFWRGQRAQETVGRKTGREERMLRSELSDIFFRRSI